MTKHNNPKSTMRKYNKKELPLRRGNSFLLDCTTKSEMDSVSISGRFFSLFPVVVQSTIGTLNDGALPLIENEMILYSSDPSMPFSVTEIGSGFNSIQPRGISNSRLYASNIEDSIIFLASGEIGCTTYEKFRFLLFCLA